MSFGMNRVELIGRLGADASIFPSSASPALWV